MLPFCNFAMHTFHGKISLSAVRKNPKHFACRHSKKLLRNWFRWIQIAKCKRISRVTMESRSAERRRFFVNYQELINHSFLWHPLSDKKKFLALKSWLFASCFPKTQEPQQSQESIGRWFFFKVPKPQTRYLSHYGTRAEFLCLVLLSYLLWWILRKGSHKFSSCDVALGMLWKYKSRARLRSFRRSFMQQSADGLALFCHLILAPLSSNVQEAQISRSQESQLIFGHHWNKC